MLKKIAALVLLSASAIYADVKLDLHVTLTKDGLVREINKQVIVVEGISTELHKTASYQAVGLVDTVTENGAVLHLSISECKDGACELVSSPELLLEWNQVAVIDLENCLGNAVHIECVAIQVDSSSN